MRRIYNSFLIVGITCLVVVEINTYNIDSNVQGAVEPTVEPIIELTVETTLEPVVEIIVEPAIEPAIIPTVEPTLEPTIEPTVSPIVEPTLEPTVTPTQTPSVDKNELDLLAHLIYAEAGSDWCKDEMLYGVGSVVLNRMASDNYPSTMYGVIYQKGQYACTWDGNINKKPNERAYRIAEDLLLNGSTLPEKVIYQAEFKQGTGVYKKVQNMYFCY